MNNLICWAGTSFYFYLYVFHSIETLELQVNNLTGDIPKEIGSLTNLRRLSLYNNVFGGTIPEGLYNLDGLEHFDITSNYFSGTISKRVANFLSMKNFYFGENLFSGTIPEEIGQMGALGMLIIYFTQTFLIVLFDC